MAGTGLPFEIKKPVAKPYKNLAHRSSRILAQIEGGSDSAHRRIGFHSLSVYVKRYCYDDFTLYQYT